MVFTISRQQTKATSSLGNSLIISTPVKKHIVALKRLVAIANIPEIEELSTASITQLLQDRNTSQNTLLVHRKIRNSSFTGLLDTHINTLAHHDDMPPNSVDTQP